MRGQRKPLNLKMEGKRVKGGRGHKASPSPLTGALAAGPKLARKALRLAALASLTALGLVAVTAILIAGYMYVSKSDYFMVKKVTISGLNRIDRDTILFITGLDGPTNTITFDCQRAEADLKTLSWLSSVTVQTQIPDSVFIEVTEHQPRLLVSLGPLYYLDDRGEPFRRLLPGENPDLPVVSGFSEDELLNPGPGTAKAMEEIFWLVEALGERNDDFGLKNISEINYDMVRGLTVFTKKRGLEVKVGFGSYTEKFRRLGRVAAYLKQRGQYEGLSYLNLEADPRVTVRYHDNGNPAGQDA